MKLCPRCNVDKPLSEFYLRKNGKPMTPCKECSRERDRLRMSDPEVRTGVRARQREWAKRNPDKVREKKNARRRRDKVIVIEAYGGACQCCGEREPAFLTIDHINGREPNHPDKNNLYRYVIRNGFPEQYRIYCFNCNCGRQINGGICPHQGPTRV